MSPINADPFGSHRGPQATTLDAFRSHASNLHGFNSRRPVSATVADSVEAPLHAEFSPESSRQPPSSTTYNEDLAIAEDDWKLYPEEDPPEEDLDPNPYRRVYRLPAPARPLVQKPKPTAPPPARPQVHNGPPQHNQKAPKQDEVQITQPGDNPNHRAYSNAPVPHSAPSHQPDYNPYRRVYGSPQQHYHQLHKRSEAEQGSAALTILTLSLLACALVGFFFAGKSVYRCVQRRREKQWSWSYTGRWSRVEEEEWVNAGQTQGKALYGAV